MIVSLSMLAQIRFHSISVKKEGLKKKTAEGTGDHIPKETRKTLIKSKDKVVETDALGWWDKGLGFYKGRKAY